MKDVNIRQKIKDLVGSYATILGLRHNPIEIKYAGYEMLENNYAEIHTDQHDGTIYISFNIEKLEGEPHEVERTVIHELLHVVFYKLRMNFDNMINHYVTDKKSDEMMKANYTDDEHSIVFLMEKILEDGFKNKNTQTMANRPIRTVEACKKPIQEKKVKAIVKKRNRRGN